MVLRIKKRDGKGKSNVCLFIVCLLLLSIYIDLMGALSEVLGFSTKITTYIYYGILWLLLLRSIPQIARSITKPVIVGIFVFFFFAVGLYLIYPEARKYLTMPSLETIFVFSPTTVLTVVPYILIGLAVEDTEKLAKYLHTGARIGVVMGALSYIVSITSGQEIHYDDMENAYALCIMACILVVDHKKGDGYFLLVGCVSLLLAGTRGPLACVIAALMIRILVVERSLTKKILTTSVAVVAVILLQGDLLVAIADWIEKSFAAVGVTQLRIIDYFRSGTLADSSGRDSISANIIEKIMEKPILGYGPGGDRIAILKDTYAHNIFLEMWVSYGVVVGTLIMGWMTYWLCKGAFGKNRALQVITVSLFCSVVIKLFLSSSYLYSKELFILLGICMTAGTSRINRVQQEEKI